MLKSKQMSEAVGCTVRKCRANEGASLIDLVGAENGRVKHFQGVFHPTAKHSCGLTSPALWPPPLLPSKQDPTDLTGWHRLDRITPTHLFTLLPEKSLHVLTAYCPMPGLALLLRWVSLPAKNWTADLQRGRDDGISLGLTQTTWLGPSTPDRARSRRWRDSACSLPAP